MKPHTFSPQELQRRRSNSRRLAWVLGGLVVLLYAIGMFIPR